MAPGGQLMKDLPIGKVRIRLSTLESDRVYTNAYPLLVVTPQGVKKMGELELAVRFSCASTVNLMHAYLQPQLPRMHYFYPLDPHRQESLRVAAMNIVALKLMRSEPPLKQEVVQFMLDTETERWSMRRSKANYYRIMVPLPEKFHLIRNPPYQKPIGSETYLIRNSSYQDTILSDTILSATHLIRNPFYQTPILSETFTNRNIRYQKH
jgi:hypothetical protein